MDIVIIDKITPLFSIIGPLMLMAGFAKLVLSRSIDRTLPTRLMTLGMTSVVLGAILTFSNSEIVKKVALIVGLLVFVVQIIVFIVQNTNREIAEIVRENFPMQW